MKRLHRDVTPALLTGPGTWRKFARSAGPRDLIVADGNVSVAGASIRIDAGATDWQSVRALADRFALCAPRTVIAVGGGSVLDAVKLACLVHADPATADLIELRAGRAGVVTVPSEGTPSVRRVFVPTTVGTGGEVSPVACLSLGGRKRLVLAKALRPDLAILDPELTATLPAPLLREGVLEALLRVIGPVVGGGRGGGLPDAEAAMLARQLHATGNRIADGDTGTDARLTAAMLSSTTHTGWALAGRAPFSPKHWYLANELSTALGLRKMVATACLLPALWSRVVEGDRRFGDPGGLAEAWSWLADSEPVTGLRTLLRRWRIEHLAPAPAAIIRLAAERAVRWWGGRLPMLAGLDVDDVERLYRDAMGARADA